MTINMSSGAPPYEYATGLEFIAGNTNESKIGISGILFEQAQFVTLAELRKFDDYPPGGGLDDLPKLWVNFLDPGMFYEPRADGANLGGDVFGPAIIGVDAITQTRDFLDVLFSAYAKDSLYNGNFFKEDWLRGIRPSEDESDYFRDAPAVGEITSLDVSVLGGSGVIYDVDAAEIMFQPFPFIATTRLLDTHGTNSEWRPGIIAGPLFPCFQTTDGSVISTNGRENQFPEDPPKDLADLNFSSIASGVIQINGYAMNSNTEFGVGQDEVPFFDVANATFAAGSARVPPINNIQQAIETSRVYVTPTAQSEGVQFFGARNPLDYNTPVSSGLVSFWPTTTTFDAEELGFEVFDRCWWLVGFGARDIGSSFDDTGNPSGVIVTSPYTHNFLWERVADVAAVDERPVLRDISRRDTDELYALDQVVSATGDADFASIFEVRMLQYNDLLDITDDFTVEVKHDFAGFGSANARRPAFFAYDEGSDQFWFMGVREGVASFGFSVIFYLMDSTFNFIEAFAATTVAPLTQPPRGFFVHNDFIYVMTSNQQIWKYEYTGAAVSLVNTKVLDIAGSNDLAFGANSTFPRMNHAIHVSDGSPYVTNGFWMTISNTNQLFVTARGVTLIRVSEGVTEWSIDETHILTTQVGANNDPAQWETYGSWWFYWNDVT